MACHYPCPSYPRSSGGALWAIRGSLARGCAVAAAAAMNKPLITLICADRDDGIIKFLRTCLHANISNQNGCRAPRVSATATFNFHRIRVHPGAPSASSAVHLARGHAATVPAPMNTPLITLICADSDDRTPNFSGKPTKPSHSKNADRRSATDAVCGKSAMAYARIRNCRPNVVASPPGAFAVER